MSINITETAAVNLRQRQGKLADNITNNNALLNRLQSKGNIKNDTGGRTILEELIYAENSTNKWYNGLETFNIVEEEVIDAAEYNRKFLAAFVYFSGEDKLANKGKHQAINLIKARTKVAEQTLKNAVGLSLFSDGTGSNSKELGGLQLLIDDDPTSAGTIGGINQVTSTFWQNQYTASVAMTSSTIRSFMNLQWLTQVRGTDKPDLIVTDSVMYDYYESSLQENIRYSTSKMADAGFEAIKYKSADVVYDENCTTKRMYFINSDYLSLQCSPERKFSVGDSRTVTNADYDVIPIMFAGALTCSNRALQGVMIAA